MIADTNEWKRSQAEWDAFWMAQAQNVAKHLSKDPSTKVGAVLVQGKDQIAFGYNGFSQSMPDDPAIYADRAKKYPAIVHAELNALLKPRSVKGPFTLYCTFHPCDRCVGPMDNAGVTRVVFPIPSEDDVMRWGKAFSEAAYQMRVCNMEVVML